MIRCIRDVNIIQFEGILDISVTDYTKGCNCYGFTLLYLYLLKDLHCCTCSC